MFPDLGERVVEIPVGKQRQDGSEDFLPFRGVAGRPGARDSGAEIEALRVAFTPPK